MKIGFLSDIHSDVKSLQETLAFLEDQAVDSIYCLGDVVEMGRGDGDTAVEIIQQAGIPCVQGNHDQFTVQKHAWQLKNWETLQPENRIDPLKPETLEYLSGLAGNLRDEWAGKQIFLNHGTWLSLTPHSPDRFFYKIANLVKADVILLGHTHLSMKVIFNGVHFYNPGAVVARQGGVTCATLTLPELDFQVWNVATHQLVDVPLIEIQMDSDDSDS